MALCLGHFLSLSRVTGFPLVQVLEGEGRQAKLLNPTSPLRLQASEGDRGSLSLYLILSVVGRLMLSEAIDSLVCILWISLKWVVAGYSGE